MPSKSDLKRIARELESLTREARSASNRRRLSPEAVKRIQESIRRKVEERDNPPERVDHRPQILQDLGKISNQLMKSVKEFYSVSRVDSAGYFKESLLPSSMFDLNISLKTIREEGYIPSNSKLGKMFTNKIAEAERYVYTQWMKSNRDDLIDALDMLGAKIPRNFGQLESILGSDRSLSDLKRDFEAFEKSFMVGRKLKFRVYMGFKPSETGQGGSIHMTGVLYKLLRNEIELFDDTIQADTNDQLVRKFKALCDKNLKLMT